ncbi:carbohydrate ABC transporter permease [Catenuloplanes atrovinosus]|uniref:Xylobiose transport system permease protein n=1 Tax=Catenuloplanes atrovinosus TaxID=137266 RepID=A0AAE4CDI4_9ACTN|nr:carbohydrate ABC transporter permease [Catenuloplanes atrovinosus]MDR7280646.1 xylobiose transport system permease protein [Catenuloplanes atrovinosus]
MAVSTPTRSAVRPAPRAGGPRRSVDRPNWAAGALSLVWLAVVGFPLLLLVIWSLTDRRDYQRNGPLALPDGIAWANISQVFEARFGTYMLNTFTVTAGSILLTLALALPAAYAIVRSRSWAASLSFRMFLLGLAIPAQAVIVPVYLIITRLELYDTLRAVILPTVAFNLPLVVLILSGSLRDVSRELYEAMTVDGAGPFRIFWKLVLPMSRGSISTVGIFVGLNAWNGFIFPLILTQDLNNRVVALGLWHYQGQYAVNVPGLMMAVLLSTLPIFLLYLFARRWLIAGLAGVGGK